MDRRFWLVGCAMQLLLGACGGGSGGVASTPTPTPTPAPAPTPAPQNTTLSDLRASQSFINNAVSNSVGVRQSDSQTVSVTQATTTLSVSYDAASQSYTLNANGNSQSFGNADKVAGANPGQIDYRKDQGGATQYLTLLEPNSSANGNIKYVGAGYWQRNSFSNGTQFINFDAFTYGLPTSDAAVPRTGRANYAVSLFGFIGAVGEGPRILDGSGTFSVDFASGDFATSGSAYEVDLTADYYTSGHGWQGSGKIASANLFNGRFAYQARQAGMVNGSIDGRFYGPAIDEVGAVFHAGETGGVALTGTLVGAKSSDAPMPLTVVDPPLPSTFVTSQSFTSYIRAAGATRIDGAASQFPDQGGRLERAADGSITLLPSFSSNSYPHPTFAAADRDAAASNARYTFYRKEVGNDSFKLTLYNPGASNDELALTYASFGSWHHVARSVERDEVGDIWFVYGVPTPDGTGPRTGSASYDTAIHGSGATFADSRIYTLAGQSRFNVDFGTLAFSGTLNPVATSSEGSLALPALTYAGTMGNNYAFQSFLGTAPGRAEGFISGRLYGPNAEEIASRFDFVYYSGGLAAGQFAGITIGKR